MNPRRPDERAPRLTVGARRADPCDLDAERRDDPPLTRRFPPAITGSAAIARISTKAKEKTCVRFETTAFTSHLQTGHEARSRKVFPTRR